MNGPLQSYRKCDSANGTRIGLILDLFNIGISRIERGYDLSLEGKVIETESLILESQFVVHALASAYLPPVDAFSKNMIRLYEFCLFCLSTTEPEKLLVALNVLKTLQAGFLGIRKQMIQMEKQGGIAPLEALPSLHVVI